VQKHQVMQITAKINEVLFEIWDPISIKDEGAPRDEYEGYAFAVLRLLTSGAKDSEITDYLGQVEQTRMGLSGVGTTNWARHMNHVIEHLRRIDLGTGTAS